MNLLPKPKLMKLDETSRCEDCENIQWQLEPTLPFEGYQIEIAEQGIVITYADEHAKWYAQTTLEELKKYKDIPCGRIQDYPKYAYRGVHLDVARFYLKMEDIYHFIDLIATLKFNVLHLHLTDEQGWRIHIPAYPRLSEIGSVRACSTYGRTQDKKPHSGFYTKRELGELVAYAKSKGIDILPEIEMPGHCSPILAAYPTLSCHGQRVEVKTRGGVYDEVLCAGNEDVFTLLEAVIDECCTIFPYPYIHIGADEAKKAHWRSCPKCQRRMEEEGLQTMADLQDYFVNRMASYIASKGKKAIMFSDGLRMHHRCKDVDVQYWVGDVEQSKRMMERGSQLIVSTHGKYYFDLGYGQTSLKSTYEYDPEAIFSPYEKSVKGVEGMLWAEFMPDYATRLYQAFPRLLALSETAWNGMEKEPYETFVKRCRHFICEHQIPATPEKYWNMSKRARILDAIRYYHRTMTRQDIRQFLAVLKNEKEEKAENEKIIRNETD